MGCDIHAWLEYRPRPDRAWKVDVGRGHRYTDDFYQWADAYDRKRILACYEKDEGAYRGKLDISRNYLLYALIAGVRDYEDPAQRLAVYEDRGLPADASRIIWQLAKNDGSDGHSHSYLSPSELRQCLEKYQDHRGPLGYGEHGADDLDELWWISKYGVDGMHRLVFWFDN